MHLLTMLTQYEWSSNLDLYFGHFLLIVNAYKGGPRTQIFKAGGGASFSRGWGVPKAHTIEII